MNSNDGIRHIRTERAHFGVRVQSMHFPLDQDDLAEIVEAIKYTWNVQRPRFAGLPSGVRIGIAGQIAQGHDGDSSLSVIPDQGILTIDGKDQDLTINDFLEVERVIVEQMVPDWAEHVRFYELILGATASVTSDRDPIREIQRIRFIDNLNQSLSEIIGASVTSFGLRLVQQGHSPGDEDWVEYQITPSILKPKTEYDVNVIFRSPDREIVVTAAGSAIENVRRILGLLGQGS